MAEWRDGSKFTLCLALECRERDPSRCVYQPSWAMLARGQVSTVALWAPIATHKHTQTQMPPPSYTQSCTCTHPLTQSFICPGVYTQLHERL